jgi:hypothetical protein
MRALTLTQPYAGFVAAGLKLVENRSRSMVRREDFGVPFALHASREIDRDAFASVDRIAPELQAKFAADRKPPRWHRLASITSAVIAVATIDRAVALDRGKPRTPIVYDLHTHALVDLGAQLRWFVGPIGYVLRDVRALPEPVPCRGWQGFWTLTPDIEARVVAQLWRMR